MIVKCIIISACLPLFSWRVRSYLGVGFILFILCDEFLSLVEVAVGEEDLVEPWIPLGVDELHELLHRHHLVLALTATAEMRTTERKMKKKLGFFFLFFVLCACVLLLPEYSFHFPPLY